MKYYNNNNILIKVSTQDPVRLEKNGIPRKAKVLVLKQDCIIDPSNGEVVNKDLFRRRDVGLTSYLRCSQEKLMSRFELKDRGE